MTIEIAPTPIQQNSPGYVRQVLRNVGQAVGEWSESILQGPDSFKTNALPFSSLILVLSRIGVSSYSAVQARNTEDEGYRTREAGRTFVREAGGFLASFGLLMALTAGTKSVMRQMWGIPTAKGYSLLTNLGRAFQGKRLPTHVFNPAHSTPFEYDGSKAAGFIRLINRFRQSPLTKAAERRVMKATYDWTPITLGSVTSLYVSGFLLEQFTRNQAHDVVNRLTGRKQNKTTAETPIAAQNTNMSDAMRQDPLDNKNNNRSNPYSQPASWPYL